MGLFDKECIRDSIERIKLFCPPEGYYLAFSGGKDSVVLYDLAVKSGVKFDAHYNITGIDPPELYRFIKQNYPDVQRHLPEKTMWQLIVKGGMPPTRIARYCCRYLKETGGHGRRVLTGVRWEESHKRSKRQVVEHCMKDKTKDYVNPIIDWTENQVWQYIRKNGLKYCSLYDERFKRLGCIGCPMAGKKGRLREFARWPKYKRAYIRAFQRMLAKKPVDEEWTSGEDVFEWWLNEKTTKKNSDHSIIFE